MRPQDLTPTQYVALLCIINPANWERDRFGMEKMNGATLSRVLGYSTTAYGYKIARDLITKEYIDHNFKPTQKCNGMPRNFKLQKEIVNG